MDDLPRVALVLSVRMAIREHKKFEEVDIKKKRVLKTDM